MSDQSAQMLSILRQIETNTRSPNTRSPSTPSTQSDVTAGAVNSLSEEDINAVTGAINSQTDAINSQRDALETMSESVQDSLSYGEKLQEMADKNKSSLFAWGKMIDDVLGGKIGKVGKSIFNFGGKVSNASKTFSSFFADLKKLNKELPAGASNLLKYGARANFVVGAFAKILGPVGIVLSAIGGTMIKIFTQTLKMGAKLTKFFVALPLTMASSAARIGNSIRQDINETIANAVEETQTLFDMSAELGGRIGVATQGLSSFAMKATTLHAFKNVTSDFVKLFGTGSSGVTKMISEYTKMLTDSGVFADIFAESIGKVTKKGPENLILLSKATQILGMTTQDFGYVALESAKNGDSLYKSLDDIMSSVNNTSKEFGLNSKLISKNFFVLRNDIINFGHLTNDQLTETVGKITQMGVSVKEASGMFNKFGTFEDAANSAALLSQTFGMNVDALKLIRAEKPEEIIEMFSDAMFATGRSFDELNRHEKAVMAQYTGLSAEALKSVMNYKTMGMTYAEIQKKMAEEDPTVQQRKNIESMTGSLREMQKVITDTSFIESFKRGLTATITLASGLDPIFTQISQRMQDFYISGLELPANVKESIKGIFSPITEAFEKLVGTPGSEDAGIFNKKMFSSLAMDFTTFIGEDLKAAFDTNPATNKSIISIQKSFERRFSQTFTDLFNNPQSTTAGQLMLASGELVGKFLRGFAAIGPGLIKTLGKAFRETVAFLKGNDSQSETINKIFTDFFKLDKADIVSIKKTFYDLVKELKDSAGPLFDLFYFINKEMMKIAVKIGAVIADAIYDALPDMMKTDSRVATNAYKSSKAQGVDFNKAVQSYHKLNNRKSDQEESRASGNILAYLEEEAKKDSHTGRIAKQLLAQNFQGKTFAENIKEGNIAKDAGFNLFGSNYDVVPLGKVMQEEVYSALLRIENEKERIRKGAITMQQPAEDYFSDLLNGGKAVIQGLGNNFSMQPLADGDQIAAAKEGGPIVAGIRYSGDMAAEVYRLISGMFSPGTNGNNQSSNQPLAPIIIRNEMVVDGKTLATSAVKADIVGLMNNKNLGGSYSTLSDGTISNPSFGSTQGSAI